MNETIARLDRDAVWIGVTLTHLGDNARRFYIHPGRYLDYRPGGKGVLRVRAYVDGQLEAETVVSIERMRALLHVGSRARVER
jgi:hypothetical protein